MSLQLNSEAYNASIPMVEFLSKHPQYTDFMMRRITDGIMENNKRLIEKLSAYECIAVAMTARRSPKNDAWVKGILYRHSASLGEKEQEWWAKFMDTPTRKKKGEKNETE